MSWSVTAAQECRCRVPGSISNGLTPTLREDWSCKRALETPCHARIATSPQDPTVMSLDHWSNLTWDTISTGAMTSRSNRLLGPEMRPCIQSESHSYSRRLNVWMIRRWRVITPVCVCVCVCVDMFFISSTIHSTYTTCTLYIYIMHPHEPFRLVVIITIPVYCQYTCTYIWLVAREILMWTFVGRCSLNVISITKLNIECTNALYCTL